MFASLWIHFYWKTVPIKVRMPLICTIKQQYLCRLNNVGFCFDVFVKWRTTSNLHNPILWSCDVLKFLMNAKWKCKLSDFHCLRFDSWQPKLKRMNCYSWFDPGRISRSQARNWKDYSSQSEQGWCRVRHCREDLRWLRKHEEGPGCRRHCLCRWRLDCACSNCNW